MVAEPSYSKTSQKCHQQANSALNHHVPRDILWPEVPVALFDGPATAAHHCHQPPGPHERYLSTVLTTKLDGPQVQVKLLPASTGFDFAPHQIGAPDSPYKQ